MATPLRPVSQAGDIGDIRDRHRPARSPGRRILAGFAAAGLVVGLVACGSDDSDDPGDPVPAPEPAGGDTSDDPGEEPAEDPMEDEPDSGSTDE